MMKNCFSKGIILLKESQFLLFLSRKMHEQSVYRTGELYYATGNPNHVTKG
jgi:hypothetical protein